MFKLDLEEAEEPEIILPASTGSQKKQENSRKTSTFVSFTMLKTVTVDHNKLWKILQEVGIRDHLTCLLRNPYASQEETELDIEQQTDFKSGKEYFKVVYFHPAYLT